MSEVSRINAAAEWMQRLQSESADETTIRDWIQWCEADVRNQQAFDRVREVLQVADGLAAEVQNGELIGSPTSNGDGNEDRSTPTNAERLESVRRWPLRYPLRALAATVAAVAIAVTGWIALTTTGYLPVRNGAVIASNQPVRAAMLPDGSRVEIASKSTVEVNYTGDTRVLELQDGEAYFSVTPDKQRPFVVKAGAVSVRAVGTAFNVRRAAERVVVTITEGTVDVYRQSSAPVRAGAGSQVVWSAGAEDAVVTSVMPARAAGWREGRLEYINEPLEAVVADINRYAARPVVVADTSARNLRFSGTVMVGLTDEWLSALPRQFPITLQRQNGVDMIHSAPARR